jgi:DNA-binding MarR family transcriptional regulator
MPIKFVYEDAVFNNWNLIHQTYDSLMQCQEKVCSAHGITSKQQATLSAIALLPDPVTLKDLADCFDRDSASITFIIDRMEKEGLVTRIRDLKDRRSCRLTLTAKGMEILEVSDKSTKQLSQKIMKSLSQKDLSTLTALIEKIMDKTYEYRKVKRRVKEIRLQNP